MDENFVNYLNFLDKKLKSFFEKQKPYIFCKKGCAKCCKQAHFPYSEAEFKYLILGLKKLPKDKQETIEKNIKKTIKDKLNHKEDNYRYNCPFLLNDECSVYDYRGIICRSFGLMYRDEKGALKVPFCALQGQNYSNVLKDKKLSMEEFKKTGLKQKPLTFSVDYKFLTDDDFAKGFKFSFGEIKQLIDWLIAFYK